MFFTRFDFQNLPDGVIKIVSLQAAESNSLIDSNCFQGQESTSFEKHNTEIVGVDGLL